MPFFRDADRADIGVEVQLPAQSNIGALHGAAFWGRRRALQENVTGLDLGQHVSGDSFTFF